MLEFGPWIEIQSDAKSAEIDDLLSNCLPKIKLRHTFYRGFD